MKRGRLVILVACMPLSCIAAPSGLPNIDTCVERLDPQVDIGYDRISAKCPELLKQLDQGTWAAWLPPGWKEPGNDLSAGSLKELRDLVSREEAAHVMTRGPDVSGLKIILAGLADQQAEGWWTRFKSWLRSILEARQQAPDESWFSRMVSQVGLSQSLRQLVAYAALGAVLLLAAGVVINELRAAGLLSGRPPRQGASPQRAAAENTLSDIEHSALLDRPRLLLELLVRRLGERGFLPPSGSLTVRELTRAVQLPEPDDRARLQDVALTAESVRYSAHQVEAATVEESVVRGRELLARLESPPGSGGSS